MTESLDLAALSAEQLEVWRQVERLWNLASRRDARGIRESLHPDYVGWDTNAPLPHDREAAVHSVTADAPRLVGRALCPLSVCVYEGSVGVVHYRYEATVQATVDRQLHATGKWTEVYIKRGSRWLMVAVSGRPDADPEGKNGEAGDRQTIRGAGRASQRPADCRLPLAPRAAGETSLNGVSMNQEVLPAVAASLHEWHRMVECRDPTALPALLHPDVVFRSPVAFKPYRGAPAVALILRTVLGVFEDFAYERQFSSAAGFDVALEFSARVGDRELKGIDLIRFDAEGRIVDFEVMIRPASGLQALGEEMGRRLAAVLPGGDRR